ncbi:hypothetical protein OIU77_022546 [Salix suchowensis]|uniref:Uncharacterized protein n=1 Tax=Salix suchowensis TaxID=1278906 RepID=A0ABQ9C4P1_9ROSI|nr:hypothetical protein OIU77_022546 [Salix suchowensis]
MIFVAGAMKLKSVIMNRPPVIQKGSISMNHFETPDQDIEKVVADGKEVLQF